MKHPGMLVIAGFLIGIGEAQASCGAAFCSTANDWLTLTQGVHPGWLVWGQLEYLNQDQLREGTQEVSRDQIEEHHEEIKTINRNALLGAEYGFAQNWAVNLIVPYSNREHEHIHNHHGTEIPESWQFDNLGDVRLKVRYQSTGHLANEMSWTLNGGLKLPTGQFDVQNSEGETAERSVQPGTGTTDLLLGGGVAYAPLSMPVSLFANLQLQSPLNERDGYKPGWRGGLQVGGLYPITGKLDLVIQANLLHSGSDSGANAEPDESGRTQIAIVPGLTYSWSNGLMIYGMVEFPVYQNVNGIQLTYDYAASMGMSMAFK